MGDEEPTDLSRESDEVIPERPDNIFVRWCSGGCDMITWHTQGFFEKDGQFSIWCTRCRHVSWHEIEVEEVPKEEAGSPPTPVFSWMMIPGHAALAVSVLGLVMLVLNSRLSFILGMAAITLAVSALILWSSVRQAVYALIISAVLGFVIFALPPLMEKFGGAADDAKVKPNTASETARPKPSSTSPTKPTGGDPTADPSGTNDSRPSAPKVDLGSWRTFIFSRFRDNPGIANDIIEVSRTTEDQEQYLLVWKGGVRDNKDGLEHLCVQAARFQFAVDGSAGAGVKFLVRSEQGELLWRRDRQTPHCDISLQKLDEPELIKPAQPAEDPQLQPQQEPAEPVAQPEQQEQPVPAEPQPAAP